MQHTARTAFSIELALVIGLPLLAIIGGAWAAALAFGHGFTPVTDPPAVIQPR